MTVATAEETEQAPAISALQTTLHNEVWPKVTEKFGITNPMALPRLDKIVVNVGMGDFLENNKLRPEARDTILNTLSTITGQQPILIKAKKSVSNFKVREGALGSTKVTMRRVRMWSFLERLIHLAIPRVRDFRGLSRTSFDAAGNYSFGFSEQAVWPEIDMGSINISHGMHINLVFRNSTPEISRFVLTELGFPFKREDETG
ncbi:MAG: 50S ribosomal protein L5 [Planctomycetes bacterium]|nr:50S ribosomal protein L5 [Planctomycetota bacterium]NOG54820.1 50S ribosomal protein L5 [Planctomycetota bacterium]